MGLICIVFLFLFPWEEFAKRELDIIYDIDILSNIIPSVGEKEMYEMLS